MNEIIQIPVNRIYENPNNPRKDKGDLTELIESIKANGLYQPLMVVNGHWEADENGELIQNGEDFTVIIGHRRLEACKQAGLDVVPCQISEECNALSSEALGIMLQENMHRENLKTKEQADAFQMMLDLGKTVDDITKATGFSETTIRHRLKMASLDKDKFEKAEERGARIEDYIALEQIEDEVQKNCLLDKIGTNNFKHELDNAVRKQNASKYKEMWRNKLQTFAIEIEDSEYKTYDYDTVQSFDSFNLADLIIPEDYEDVQYYWVDGWCFRLLKKHIEAEKTPEDIEKEEFKDKVREQIKSIKNLENQFNEAHDNFVKLFTLCKKNSTRIYEELSRLVSNAEFSWNGISINCNKRNRLILHCAQENKAYEPLEDLDDKQNDERFMSMYIHDFPINCALINIASFNNNDDIHKEVWSNDLGTYVPEYKPSGMIEYVKFLGSIGYEISDEEQAFLDGTHEVFEAIPIPDSLAKEKEEGVA